jgi:hypothetical protein
MAHVVRAFFIITAIITVTFLPFFPGGYDPLSRMLSRMAWVLGRVELLLVPIGGLWLWFFHKHGSGVRPHGWLLWITLGTSILIALVLVLIAFASSGPLLAAGTGTGAGLWSTTRATNSG